MVAFDGNRACEDAEAYYQDVVLDPSDPSVPESVAKHLKQCAHCLRRIEQLREILEQSGEGCADMDLVRELQRHFELMDAEVSCRRVKAMLPTLLIPSLRMRIPTPATVHVDHCGRCAQDLASLGALGLDPAQLTRLSRLYADDSQGLDEVCPAGDKSESGEQGCSCQRCRNEAYERRRELLEPLQSANVDGTCTRDLSMAELFDVAVPYGRTADVPEDLAEHIRSCPICLEKVQVLARIVYGILEREDGAVETVYTTTESDPTDPVLAMGLYADRSIAVQVTEAEHSTESAPTRSARTLKPAMKVAFLAAAMIPLAIVFWLSQPSASGLSTNQVVHMASSAPVVHIERRDVLMGSDILEKEMWITPGMVAIDTPEKRTVYDLAKGRKIEMALGLGTSQWGAWERIEADGVRASIYSLCGIPRTGGQLRRLDGETDAAASEGIEVWEFTREILASTGEPTDYQWQVSIDVPTRRPKMIEYRQSFRGVDDVVGTTHISYPPLDQAQAYLSTLNLP